MGRVGDCDPAGSGDRLDMGVVESVDCCTGNLSLGRENTMKVEGLIPTWRLSCGHTVVSPVISSGTRSIRICIPKGMPCPECEARAEGLPNSEWSGGDAIKGGAE